MKKNGKKKANTSGYADDFSVNLPNRRCGLSGYVPVYPKNAGKNLGGLLQLSSGVPSPIPAKKWRKQRERGWQKKNKINQPLFCYCIFR
jgi:hypothetical protein